MFETGTARHSCYNPDPVLHLIVALPGGWATWCGGGPALRENTPTQRRCRRCLALARADVADTPADEATDLDWYLMRQVAE